MLTGTEIGLLSLVVILGTTVVNGRINGRANVSKEEHEKLCSARLSPLHTDIAEIKKDVKDILKHTKNNSS